MAEFIKALIQTFLIGLATAAGVTFGAFVLLILPIAAGAPIPPILFGWIAGAALLISWVYWMADHMETH